jgi:hypothetical protein
VVGVCEDVAVPETEESEAPTGKLGIANKITLTIGMLAAISFNNQLGVVADEVGYVGTNRHLAPELVLGQATVPQQKPKSIFSFGWVATHRSRQPSEAFSGERLIPLIRPSGTFSHKGRRGKSRGSAVVFLLPLWGKVARSAG